MNVRKFFCATIFLTYFIACCAFAAAAVYKSSVDSKIIGDVRRMETEVANLFGYAVWPLPLTRVVYNTSCRDPASYYSNGTIMLSCEALAYRGGKPFLKKNALGEVETFPGYIDYLDTIAHEVGHSFSRVFVNLNDRHFAQCDVDEYKELTEGFATYVAYEILLRESRIRNDYRYERYLAARTARYLTQLRAENMLHQPSRVISPQAIAFSRESEKYIKLSMKRFSDKHLVLKDEDAVASWYPRGLMRVYALKHIFTKNGFENETVKKYFCK